MALKPLLILVVTHGIPILFLMYTATVVLLRNARKKENITIALLCAGYLCLFIEEMIRNVAHISYSPVLSSLVLSNIGIVLMCIGMHFIMLISKMDEKLPRWLTPTIYYVPLLAVVLNILLDAQLFSNQSFERIGMWNYPVYDMNYYATLLGSVVMNGIYTIPLWLAKRGATEEHRSFLNTLIIAMLFIGAANFLLGMFSYGNVLPPYPYLYIGLFFCYFLQRTMRKYEFLETFDKRYEKLFTMNPDAIVLIDNKQQIFEANPIAQKLLSTYDMTFQQLYEQFDDTIVQKLQLEEPIENMELTLQLHHKAHYFLVSADTLSLEYVQYRMILLRDVTTLKEQQLAIEYMAYHDALTKLPNRRYFYHKVPPMLQRAKRNGHHIAVYLIDINNLKMLNDHIGHEAGDESIVLLADILQQYVGEHGIVARIGGDEFVMSVNETTSKISKEQLIGDIQARYAKAVAHFENIPVGTSIGYSQFPTDAAQLDTLVTLADENMYEMKKKKKFHYR